MQLYERFKGRVHFVIVDLDRSRSAAQQELIRKYYRGYIPQVTILDKRGKPVYDAAGEVDEPALAARLDALLN